MLKVIVPAREVWDDTMQRFKSLDRDYELTLEHSLISIAKWEQTWHKPWAKEDVKSWEETIDYIKCMTINPNIPDEVYEMIPDEVVDEINKYIKDPATATWINSNRPDGKSSGSRKQEIITSEIVYYYMIELGIPVEFQKWHFNRLMTLIKVVNIKREEADPNSKNKMSKREILANNAKLNAARRKAMHSKG